ncbi:hypothetical protein DRQ50_02550 [bacterium]|nr:MAG: hypothetical protein DRQ50_02550 [bacterium]
MRGLKILTAGIIALILVTLTLVAGGPRRAVDWRDLRAVVLHSDDWGFAGFAPDAAAWQGVDREALDPGRFPDAYWGSTLEDGAAVSDLADVLFSFRGRDGLPAVLQPNYILFSLDAAGTEAGAPTWLRRELPAFPAAYRRPGLWAAVAAARERGVWHPELHGAWHYDPSLRRLRAEESPAAAMALVRGITLFRDAQSAKELGPWRSQEDLAVELDACFRVFTAMFGQRPVSIIAPDYTWSGRNEALWTARGLRVIQAKREQRNPDLPPGRLGRMLKWLDRHVSIVSRPDRTFIERNCRFEPAQNDDPTAVTRRCLAAVGRAWAAGEPAVIETHRVNFVHLDQAVAARGRRELASLLGDLAQRDPGPLFMSDAEVAQLDRRGVSAVVRSNLVVVRNGSHARRIVTVPAAILPAPAGEARTGTRDPLIIAVPAGATFLVIADDKGRHIITRKPRS